jgi:hypothetical protein
MSKPVQPAPTIIDNGLNLAPDPEDACVTIALATTTFEPDPEHVRAQLAFEFADLAAQYSYPAIMVDGGSPESFQDALRARGAHVFLEVDHPHGVLGPGRRQALAAAAEYGDTVVWLEPQKGGLIPYLGELNRPIVAGEANLVNPHRTEAGFQSLSPEQMHAERFGNLAVAYAIGRTDPGKMLDIWFGAMLLDHEALDIFLKYDAAKYGAPDAWDSILISRIEAIAYGLEVVSQDVDYRYPPEQTADETGNLKMLMKRLDQLNALVPFFIKAATELGLTPVPARA